MFIQSSFWQLPFPFFFGIIGCDLFLQKCEAKDQKQRNAMQCNAWLF